MIFSNSVKIKCEVDDSTNAKLRETVYKEMNRIAAGCVEKDGALAVSGVNNSFGSILRNDVTTIRFRPSRNTDGYVVEAETEYKPSGWFWIFFVIDIVLIETIIGFVIGMGVTLGLYFYNKNLVQNGIKQALQNAAETMT